MNKKPYTFAAPNDYKLNPCSGFEKIPKGTEITVVWGENGKPTITIPSLKSEPFSLGNKFLIKILGKKVPSLTTLERWSDDGVAKTILGTKTEPDGYGNYGEPSWLLVMGLI